MTKVYEDFFRDLLSHEEDLSPYVDSLYKNEKYTEEDLNYIFGQLKSEGLITCMYGDNRAWVHSITFEGKHYFDDDKMGEIMAGREPKIFISHSSKDEKYVKWIVALLTGMGLNHKQVFCSSLPGFGIPLDTNIFDYLRDQFLNFDLHVIFVHSENYYQSAVSLNEMGAAWALKTDVTSILLPGFEYSQMAGVVKDQAIAIKLDHSEQEVKNHLNQLREKIIGEFAIEKQPDILWEQNRDSFMQGILSVQTGTLQNGKKTEGEVFSEELKELLTLAAEDQSGQILKTSNISSGRIIQIGDKEIFLDDSPREGAL